MSVWGCILREAVMKIQLVPAKPLHVVGSGEECTGVVDRLEFFVYSLALMAGLILTVLVIWRLDVYQQERQAAGKGLCECPKSVLQPGQVGQFVEKLPRIKRDALPWKRSKPKKDAREGSGLKKAAGMGAGTSGDLHPALDLGFEMGHIAAHPLAELTTKSPSTLGPSTQKDGGGGWGWGLSLLVGGIVLCLFFCCSLILFKLYWCFQGPSRGSSSYSG